MYVNELEAEELAELISSGDDFQLIDVRSHGEAERGVIPEASHVPLHLLPLHVQQVAERPKVVFYCHSGARSARACLFMRDNGHDHVYNLRGGILAWVRSGKPVSGLAA